MSKYNKVENMTSTLHKKVVGQFIKKKLIPEILKNFVEWEEVTAVLT